MYIVGNFEIFSLCASQRKRNDLKIVTKNADYTHFPVPAFSGLFRISERVIKMRAFFSFVEIKHAYPQGKYE